MAGRLVDYGGGDALNQQQKRKIFSHDQSRNSIFKSASSNSFVGSSAMVSFGAFRVNRSGNSFYQSFDQEESGDECLDEYFNQSEKKRRLTVDQVQFLEQSFEAENKLEPERKSQLASELGLQPRQIAVWFQNRRARLKTKQVETEYETLHTRYRSLKMDYDNLLKENERLKAEVFHLKDGVLARDKKKGKSQLCDTKALSEVPMTKSVFNPVSRDEKSEVLAVAFNNEDQNSARSDVTDLDSPRFTNGICSSLFESGDSLLVFEPDQSDFNDELQAAYIFPKIEDGHCLPLSNSCYFGFPVEDHGFNFWSF